MTDASREGVISDDEQLIGQMSRTTIPLDSSTRDRLRTYGSKGMDYDEILQRLMDEVDRERFVAEQRRRAAEDDFVPLDDA